MTQDTLSSDTGDAGILEEAGIAFDPASQHLDLSKAEKRRTTALMLAIQAYRELIIREGTYLKEAADLARRNEGPKLQPATINAMVEAAIKFDLFIEGKFTLQELQPEQPEEAAPLPAQPLP